MYKIIHNLVEIRAEHLLITSDGRTRGIAAFRTIKTGWNTIYTWNCTGRVIDPSPAWNWSIVLA
jgi:hypothetical protein